MMVSAVSFNSAWKVEVDRIRAEDLDMDVLALLLVGCVDVGGRPLLDCALCRVSYVE